MQLKMTYEILTEKGLQILSEWNARGLHVQPDSLYNLHLNPVTGRARAVVTYAEGDGRFIGMIPEPIIQAFNQGATAAIPCTQSWVLVGPPELIQGIPGIRDMSPADESTTGVIDCWVPGKAAPLVTAHGISGDAWDLRLDSIVQA